ncbi:chromosome segregation protein SMC [bacterium]|nr:chromosome segregation protein SMC [bacterium]
MTRGKTRHNLQCPALCLHLHSVVESAYFADAPTSTLAASDHPRAVARFSRGRSFLLISAACATWENASIQHAPVSFSPQICILDGWIFRFPHGVSASNKAGESLYLSGLELYGFKSFPTRTKLTFSPGVMAIVGPNGCGKTNIVDAVRWVLGEQRAGILRSDKMENVIFAGAGAKKPSKFAEVTLIVENTLGLLPTEYSEVAITRRLHRSGESEYMINRRTCRLRDIRTLFADTGLGPDSYSIIELAMVESILSGRPEERRRLFEEAAGVTLYKQRLRTARSRLAATEADILRLDDIIREITTQRNSLKRQVQRARRYRWLRDALRVKELTAATGELADLRVRIAPLEAEIVAQRSERDDRQELLEKQEEDLEKLRKRLGELENRVSEIGKRRDELSARRQAVQKDIVILEERIRTTQVRGEERESEREKLTDRRRQLAREIESLDDEHETAEQARTDASQALEEVQKQYEAHDKAIRGARSEQAEAARALREAENALTAAGNEVGRIVERMERIDARLEELAGELEEPAPSDPEPRREKVQELQHSRNTLQTEIEAARKTLEAAREARAEAASKAAGLKTASEAAHRRVEMLTGMVRSGEGRPKAVKELLEAGIEGLLGRLGDAVTTGDAYRPALAAALGDRADALATADRRSFAQAAERLYEHQTGQGQLLYETSLEGEAEAPFSNDEGVIAPLCDVVSFTGTVGEAARRLLRKVQLVRDLQALLHYADDAVEGGWTLVTPDGVRLTPDGVLVAGEVDPADLGAAHLLEEAQREAGQARTALTDAERELESARTEEKAREQAPGELSRKLKDIGRELEQAQAALHKAESERQAHEAVQQRRREEKQRLEVERESLEPALLQQQNRLSEATEVEAKRRDMLHEAGGRLRALEEENEKLRRQRDEAYNRRSETAAETARIESEVRRRGTLLEELGRRLDSLEKEKQGAVGALEDARERLRSVRGEEAVIEKELDEVAVSANKAAAAYEEVRKTFRERESDVSEQRSELQRIGERLHALELEVKDYSVRMTTIRERIIESYEIDLFSAPQESLPLAVEEDNPYMDRPLGELRDGLKTIGPVNQMALEEYEVIDARWQTLKAEYDDLAGARAALEETISEINGVARKRFLDTFGRVHGNFQDLFVRLFGGGEARLELADGDPLEAGIKIFATPRGKNLSAIDLLSGGEKALTAIALLFALYLERPSPFCFLDEVDAPLDDSNVGRFADLLEDFTDRTQFLVVTHNKLTMERADRLYGVTMEEEGSSRLVAVEIAAREMEKDDGPVTDD